MPLRLAALFLLAWPAGAAAAEPGAAAGAAAAKASLAVAGCVWLLLGLARGRASVRLRRAWDAGLALLAVLAVACWFNLFRFHYHGFGHPSETFHYYLGAKYFDELGYTRLYRCVAVAEAEAGREAAVRERYLRDLTTNRVVSAATALREPEACTRHFSPERWESFRRDVGWFHGRPTLRRWNRMQTDHGYNATPVWTFFGRLLAGSGPASAARILALQLLDPLLLLLAGAAVARVFGWRTLCVGLLYWGTNQPAQYGWVGGSILRELELAAVLGALCCLRRDRALAGGYLLGLAALVRVYPALLLGGPALQVLAESLRQRRLRIPAPHRRLLLGAALAVATLVPLAAVTTGGLSTWAAFAGNSRVLLQTPLRNHVGLRTLLSHEPGLRADALVEPRGSDPYLPWKQARQAAFQRRAPWFAVGVLGFAALLLAAVRREPLWAATALGVGLVPVAAELTCYYWAILVVYALLWRRHPPIGIGLCALAAAGWALAARFPAFDAGFVWISAATLIFVAFATFWAAWAGPTRNPTRPGGDAPGEVDEPRGGG